MPRPGAGRWDLTEEKLKVCSGIVFMLLGDSSSGSAAMWIKLFRGTATSPGIVQQKGVLSSTGIKEKTNRAAFRTVSPWFP